MILQSLYELYDRLRADESYELAPWGHSLQKITFKVVISRRGELIGVQDARLRQGRRFVPRQLMVPGGAKKSGKGLNPGFLWDNTAYMLGYEREEKKRERAPRSHESFRQRHLDLEDAVGSAAFSAVCRFLERWDVAAATENPILAEVGGGFGVFQIEGETFYVHEDPAVSAWWERQAMAAKGLATGQCLVTGEVAPIAPTHPPIKGVRGAQSTGGAIVSFNESAYESYGRRQSRNAPVSDIAAFRYTAALNALLDGPMKAKHRLSIGDATVVFWTETPTVTEDIFARFAVDGSAGLQAVEVQNESLRQKLHAFLNALRRGREAYSEVDRDAEQKQFFLLGLSPNAARLSVRFFHCSTLSDLLENLRRHYRDIAIAPRPARGKRPADPEFPSLWMLIRETGRKPEDVPPLLAGPLLRAVVTGSLYPSALCSAVLRRIRADQVLSYPRACVIKGFLSRNLGKEISMSLDTQRPEPAYRLGRLFAALEKTQKDALGENINATIRDRFYGSASASPRSVVPRLLRTYQHHLAKLEGGLKVDRERLIQEILDPIRDFPSHLDLAGQGLFALGYYQQMQAFYTRRDKSSKQPEEGRKE